MYHSIISKKNKIKKISQKFQLKNTGSIKENKKQTKRFNMLE